MDFFVDKLREGAREQGSKSLYRWVDDKGKVVRSLTYKEFDDETEQLAITMLSSWGIKSGEKVMLVYPPGLDFIIAFVACLKAGVVAVPVYPPRPGLSKDLSMFISVQSNCKAQIALSNTQYNYAKRAAGFKQLFTGTKVKWPELKWLLTDSGKFSDSTQSLESLRGQVDKEDIAFFQYTSGSTAAPKGVMITQENLAHNLKTIVHALNASSKTVVVSWLPCYHDMGLIGSLLGAAYCGGSGTYMSPVSFIKNPVLWLEMISKYHATHIQAPNFAYKLTVRKFKERGTSSTLDLSSLEHIFNAAEPIEADGMDEFIRTFAPYKLLKSAMSPGYGLAEHTVYVCDRGEQRLSVDKRILEAERQVVLVEDTSNVDRSGVSVIVGCGNPHRNSESNGIQVRIVQEDTLEELPEDQVGEIWVDSTSKASGYFGMEEKTKSDFHARIKGDSSDRTWLRTGDLGFFHNDELFVCGRIKDLIIVRGRNHFPQDIEHTVEQCDPLIRPGCVAAFTTGDSQGRGEHLGVVAEVRDAKAGGFDSLSSKIRQFISKEHGVLPYVVVLIKDRTIPKTTSGKISRFRARAAFEKGELQELHRWVGDLNKNFLEEEDQADIDQSLSKSTGPDPASTTEATTPVVDAQESKPSGDQQASSGTGFIPIGERDPKVGNIPSGDDLMDSLKQEVARLIEGDPAALDSQTALIHLGMDSMALTQFKGILETLYKTDLEEIELFDEETTLEYVRSRIEGAPMAAKFVEGGPAPTTSASNNTNNETSKPAKVKRKKKKSELFGCFKLCGC